MIKKIILGTANFGSDYGIVNKSFIKPVVAKKILSIALKNGISNLDTAPDYKNSEIISLERCIKIKDIREDV